MKESYIRKLIKILENSKIDSLYITSFWGMKSIKLSRNSTTTILPNNSGIDSPGISVNDNQIDNKDKIKENEKIFHE